MTPRQAVAFVRKHGVVLESAVGPLPNLAAAIAGETIRGSWWSHGKAKEIFKLTRHVRNAPNVLVCRLIDRKVTYVDRRLWPALLRLTAEIDADRTNVLQEVHTEAGKHKTQEVPIGRWAPAEALSASRALSHDDAISILPPIVLS